MISAVLLDFGGTLDGEGEHWFDRFHAIWQSMAPGLPDDLLKAAFYEADRQLEADPTINACGFEEMMRRHASWQLRHLGRDDEVLACRLAAAFAVPARRALGRSRATLERLRADGLKLAVVSNFYGNVATLCDEAGLGPLLDVVLDSAVVGLRKPDQALFAAALARLGVSAHEAVMVGDSFERDIRPARGVGMRTLWLAPGRAAACPDPALVDGILQGLSELPPWLAAWNRG